VGPFAGTRLVQPCTVIVICQRLNHPAIADATVSAGVHHPLQLTAESDKAADTPVNFAQVSARDAVGFRA
jgi:hypothetical protein